MKVIKRDGAEESVKLEKIVSRIKKQTYDLNRDFVEPMTVAQKVIAGIYDGITTKELDRLAAETAAAMTVIHPDYSILAGRIEISSLKKETSKNFSEVIEKLYNYVNPKTNEKAGMISDELYSVVKANAKKFDSMIVHDRDFNYEYFGYRTLERSYLLKINGQVVETPQHMLMRVAVALWGDNFTQVQKSYDLFSTKQFTHATPTLFNAGTKRPQLSSCFLIANKGDDIENLFETIGDVAKISKWAGGVGLHVHDVRAKGSYIKGTGGLSDGLVPMLKTYNDVARWINQGGRRNGSFAIYLEPWHADIFDFIDLRKNHGKEEMRARDLFLALWIPNLFMQRVEEDGNWTLMCPNECPGLSDVYDSKDSKAFTELYTSYETAGKGRKTIKARELWGKVLEAQIETGAPYVLYKDSANNKSNQKNIGVIKSSNLCTEIMEVSTPDEQAVCNLASVSLPAMIDTEKKAKSFNHQKLYDVVYQMTHNLNRVIDINYYPTKETKKSNLRHRPIGLGVQGLADVFQMLGLPFESPEAMKLNQEIFETMYFASLTASKDIARAIRREMIKAEEASTKEGETPKEIPYTAGAYETFVGSPLSKGILQFDMWETTEKDFSGRWDWEKLKKDIMKYGVRNSLLMAPMPTASTAQILGNNECFEPYTSNIYKRNTLSGEFVVVNKHLINDLISLDLWNDKMRVKILENNGSIQTIEEIPVKTREIYKTVWEMKLSNLMDMSRDRGIFICQSQSFNIFMPDVNVGKLNKALFYAWNKGLKTGMYYLRTKAKAQARQNLGIDTQITEEVKVSPENTNDAISCSIDNPEDCQMCSG